MKHMWDPVVVGIVVKPFAQIACGWFMFVYVLMSQSVMAHCCFHWMNMNATHLLLSHTYSQNIRTFFFWHKKRWSTINEHPKYQQLLWCPFTQPLQIKHWLSNWLSPVLRAACTVKQFSLGGLPWALAWRLNVISQLTIHATTPGYNQDHPHLYKSQAEVLKGWRAATKF